MNKKLVYDLPLRILHWSFAVLFIFSFIVAKTVDDEDPVFYYHMLAGLFLGAIVLLRVIWGIVGTKHSLFLSFPLHPRDLILYLKGVIKGSKHKWIGHNPASSWAAVIMLSSALILSITGILMTTGYKEAFEDVHEFFANLFLFTVILHILGLVLHSLKFGDSLAVSMIDGKKQGVSDGCELSNSQIRSSVILLLVMTFIGGQIFTHYDSQKRVINAFGKSLTLGEEVSGE